MSNGAQNDHDNVVHPNFNFKKVFLLDILYNKNLDRIDVVFSQRCEHASGGLRISQRGLQPHRGVRQPIIWQIFAKKCMKMEEFGLRRGYYKINIRNFSLTCKVYSKLRKKRNTKINTRSMVQKIYLTFCQIAWSS